MSPGRSAINVCCRGSLRNNHVTRSADSTVYIATNARFDLGVRRCEMDPFTQMYVYGCRLSRPMLANSLKAGLMTSNVNRKSYNVVFHRIPAVHRPVVNCVQCTLIVELLWSSELF